MSTQCRGGCGFFGGPSGYCSRCAPVTPTSATANNHKLCRLGCGFFGADAYVGHCSKCFAPVKDDPFLVAVVAAAFDNMEGIRRFEALGGHWSQETTREDVEKLQKVNLSVPVGSNLRDIAIARHSAFVGSYLYEAGASNDKYVRRSVSMVGLASPVSANPSDAPDCPVGQFDDSTLSRRMELLGTRHVRDDGLIHFTPGNTDTGTAWSYALPGIIADLSAGPTGQRESVLRLMTESHGCLDEIATATGPQGIIPGTSEVIPLYTPGDLNCLLHGAMLSATGMRDVVRAEGEGTEGRTVLRDAIYQSFCKCRPLVEKVCGDSDSRLAQIIGDVAPGKSSLEGGHVYALANVLRRPIVVFASANVEGSYRASMPVPARVSGVYLPTLWEPEDVFKDPILVCYTQGHFTCLVHAANPPATHTIALCDEGYIPLPVHFADAHRDCPRYLRNYRSVDLAPHQAATTSENPLEAIMAVVVCDLRYPKAEELPPTLATHFATLRSNIEKHVATVLCDEVIRM